MLSPNFCKLVRTLLSEPGVYAGAVAYEATDLEQLISILNEKTFEATLLSYIRDYYIQHDSTPSWHLLAEWVRAVPEWLGEYQEQLQELGKSAGVYEPLAHGDIPGLVKAYVLELQSANFAMASAAFNSNLKQGGDYLDGVNEITDALSTLIPPGEAYTVLDTTNAADAALERYLFKLERTKRVKRFMTGLPVIDRATGGFIAGELITVAGASCDGKSMLSVNWTYNAIKNGAHGIYVTTEMKCDEIYHRFISLHSQEERFTDHGPIPARAANKADMTPAQMKHFYGTVAKDFEKLPGKLHVVYPERELTVAGVEQLIRKADSEAHPISFVVIDYADFLARTGKATDEWRNDKGMYRAIKKMAANYRKYGIVCILPVQVSEDGKKRGEKRQRYAQGDIAGNSEIFKSSDQVYFIWSQPQIRALGRCKIGQMKERDDCYVPDFTPQVVMGKILATERVSSPAEVPELPDSGVDDLDL